MPAVKPLPPRLDRLEIALGQAIRMRRKALGLTQRQLGDRIGMTYQQVLKYEKRSNRIAAGRLYHIATALVCTVADLYRDAEASALPAEAPHDRRRLDLVRNVMAMEPAQRKAVAELARSLAGGNHG